MSIEIDSILDALVSHAMTRGVFERVNQHEPKNAPGNGLTAAIWFQSSTPVKGYSGLNRTTARLEFVLRIYSSMLQEPMDMIDPNAVKAMDLLMTAYNGDFTLDGLVEEVDLLGAWGTALSARAGYLNQDNKQYRVVDLTVPVIVNDVWEQTP